MSYRMALNDTELENISGGVISNESEELKRAVNNAIKYCSEQIADCDSALRAYFSTILRIGEMAVKNNEYLSGATQMLAYIDDVCYCPVGFEAIVYRLRSLCTGV